MAAGESLPFAVPDITEREIEAVVDVLRSRWLTTGSRARQFEVNFAAQVGSPHAVALNSCTAALHLALEALGVGGGDRVYLPAYTFAATGEVVRYLGATPVLVDVDPTTLNLDLQKLSDAIDRDLKASIGTPAVIMPVHFAGIPCEMEPIWELARARGLAVVEDAAHAFPAMRNGHTVGWMPSDVPGAVCFSFYATKTMTTGEGGMLTTAHPDLADRVRSMSLHGLSRQAWKRYESGGNWRYDILAPGYKYNLTDLAAALGEVQLARTEEMHKRRAAIAARYEVGLGKSGLQLPSVPTDTISAWHLYVVRTEPTDRDRLIELINERGVGTSVHFIPLHLHSYYRQTYGYSPADFPVSTAQFERVISLPIWSAMEPAQVERVITTVHEAVATL